MCIQQIKERFIPASYSNFAAVALFILRIIVGIAFVFHGAGKIQTPFSWMPSAPMAIPPFFQFLAALSEFGGGIALILGLLTPLASFGIGFTMVVAVCLHALILKDPFVSSTGGASYELAALYLAVNILLIAIGPGQFSADRLLFKKHVNQ